MADRDKRRILVIDDDQVILDSIRRQLRREPWDVEYRIDPIVGLDRLSEVRFDLVLTDMKMKPINGIEVLRRIKERWLNIPVLIVSAFVDDQLYEEAHELGCSGFLVKPVPKNVLLHTIRAVFGQPEGVG